MPNNDAHTIPVPSYICCSCGHAQQCSMCGYGDCQAARLGDMLGNRETVGHRPGRRMSAGERR